ncbi:gibberellin 2 oxidase, partial [Genlisea aurea]
MVVVQSPEILESYIRSCEESTAAISSGIPVIDLSRREEAKPLIVKACQEFGFFKVINHGIPMEFLEEMEAEALSYFKLPQMDKDKSGPADPFGYGNKKIGSNGDMGWVEYLLFDACPVFFSGIPESLRELVKEYVKKVKKMASEALEMLSQEMKIGEKDCLSRLINDDKSDCLFRLNHYPPVRHHGGSVRRNLIGFGEHTDPQIISVLRSNNISGLQICLRDGAWVSVPPDHTAFFFNVGDVLQVMTNGRFRSAKHRVVVGDGGEGEKSRVSMVFFGGPPLNKTINAVSSLMEEGEESSYQEFTWSQYKTSAYKTRLGDDRLRLFQK